jgi:hypothetical protein
VSTETNTAQTPSEGILQKTAKTIGSAIGTVAAKTGIAEHAGTAAPAPRRVNGRFARSEKTRMPRKEKKVLARKHAAKAQKAH